MGAWDLAVPAAGALRGEIRAGRVAHAYLFAGPAGTVKRTLADVFLRALTCESQGERPCDACVPCRMHLSGGHPDLRVLENEKSSLGVDEVRALTGELARRPMVARMHMALVPEAKKLTTQAQNALLKTLEEPAGEAVFVLLADSPRDLLPTVASRLRLVRIPPGDPGAVEEMLVRKGLEPGKARLAARLAPGGENDALALYNNREYWALRGRVKQALSALTGPESAAAAARTLKEDKDAAPGVLESVARDCMLFEDAPGGAVSSDMPEVLARFGPRGADFLAGVLALKARLAANVAWINALELLFMDISGGHTAWQP